MVIWLIGLSGSGKTTLAREVQRLTSSGGINTVVNIDGDKVRELYNNDLGHSLTDRKKNAKRICDLCKFLDEQNINVICSILSIFEESREWCKENLSDYREVFIDVPIKELERRDPKDIYKKYRNNEITGVAGLDIKFPVPRAPWLHIKNDQEIEYFLDYAKIISDEFKSRK